MTDKEIEYETIRKAFYTDPDFKQFFFGVVRKDVFNMKPKTFEVLVREAKNYMDKNK